MLKEIEQTVDGELIDKAILYLKDLMLTDLKAAQNIANNTLMSYGAVINAKENALSIPDIEVLSDKAFTELAHKMLDNITFGILLGLAIANKREEVEAMEMPEESLEAVEAHRTQIAQAIMGSSNQYVN